MRIVAGKFKGQAIKPPKTQEIRPTSDRMRESLFNILIHSYNAVEDARVLDLFAGTGALGFEAMSRGAAFVAFVDMSIQSRGLLRENMINFGLSNIAKILKRDATSLGETASFAPFTLIFVDPPYGQGLAERALVSALQGGWVADNALIIVEEAKLSAFVAPQGFKELERRDMGLSQLIFMQRDEQSL
jgi:16S rRNA (guanine966-N2)-methyltransferase